MRVAHVRIAAVPRVACQHGAKHFARFGAVRGVEHPILQRAVVPVVDAGFEYLRAIGLAAGVFAFPINAFAIELAREHIRRVARYLRDDQDLRFEMCLGTNGVNYPEDQGRELHAIYPFMSITHNRMIRLEVTCPDSDPHIPSIVDIYPANDWQERETWDLMGIVFDGHPSLTRTAMPDDWVGHPQRKDYPLGGIPVEFKGAVNAPADTRRSYN